VRAVVDLLGGGELGGRGGRYLSERSMNAAQQPLTESFTRLLSTIIAQYSLNNHSQLSQVGLR